MDGQKPGLTTDSQKCQIFIELNLWPQVKRNDLTLALLSNLEKEAQLERLSFLIPGRPRQAVRRRRRQTPRIREETLCDNFSAIATLSMKRKTFRCHREGEFRQRPAEL